MARVGVRRETKSVWERRVAVTPALARDLVAAGHEVVVERSERRVFPDADYEAAGCTLTDDLPACEVVFGVKEVPEERLLPNAAHLFFAHVIKGQSYNMPMLRHLLSIGATLLDYERITDAKSRRLVFFGRFAGLAGMIDALWTLGQRLEHEGIKGTPFAEMKPSHAYTDLKEALAAVKSLGEAIARDGVPAELQPLVIAVTGGGNVSGGVHEVLEQLPLADVEPKDLASLVEDPDASDRVVYRARFNEQHLVRPRRGGPVVTQEYFDFPERFESDFEEYLPLISVLMNGIYWTPACPRVVRKEDLPAMTRCRVIGDISCDVEGSIEPTMLATEPGDPVFTYDAETDSAKMGVAGTPPVINAVDILPAELPRDASESFASSLGPFAAAIAGANYGGTLEESGLPEEIKRSCIVWRGELTPDYSYIEEFLG